MRKKILFVFVFIATLSIIVTSASYADSKVSFGDKVKSFWKNLLGYPARVTEESAGVVADAAKGSVKVVTGEIKRVADVTAGNVAKTPELITEPIKGTAETTVKLVEGVIKAPSEAAKENTDTPVKENE